MRIEIVDHPLLAEKLAVLRDKNTPSYEFRSALHAASNFLIYEALREMPTEAYDLETPLAWTRGERPIRPPRVVPILRAGLGMLEAAVALIKDADVSFVGVAKDGLSPARDIYMSSLPEDLAGSDVMVLDPMLASGYTLIRVCDELRLRNAGRLIIVCLLAAADGIKRLEEKAYDADLYVAAVDADLNHVAFIVPGLGDAGDRQYGL